MGFLRGTMASSFGGGAFGAETRAEEDGCPQISLIFADDWGDEGRGRIFYHGYQACSHARRKVGSERFFYAPAGGRDFLVPPERLPRRAVLGLGAQSPHLAGWGVSHGLADGSRWGWQRDSKVLIKSSKVLRSRMDCPAPRSSRGTEGIRFHNKCGNAGSGHGGIFKQIRQLRSAGTVWVLRRYFCVMAFRRWPGQGWR